jgi:hypothetical protein
MALSWVARSSGSSLSSTSIAVMLPCNIAARRAGIANSQEAASAT